MKNLTFQFYSVLKNEDATPYVGKDILMVADGLGGSGSNVHSIDYKEHSELRNDILSSAYGDFASMSPELTSYIEALIEPLVDGKDDTSALWASRIAIGRCAYALTEGAFKNENLEAPEAREALCKFIWKGLQEVADKFDLQKGERDGQLLLPTTLSLIRYTERENSVIAETLWAGDSRCYALTEDGLKQLSVDDEDESGAITNLFYTANEKVRLHYIRHEIKKPCVLFVASDGVFDKFEPYDYLTVENILLSAMKENNSLETMKNSLEKLYDKIHNDDATMAVAALGFDTYSEMQAHFSARTEKIAGLYKRYTELEKELEVINQTEEEVTHYVYSRTRDRYEYIISLILDKAIKEEDDVVLIPEIKKIIEKVENEYNVSMEERKKQSRNQALDELDDYVRKNIERIFSEILTAEPTTFHNDVGLKTTFTNMKSAVKAYVDLLNDKEIRSREEELSSKQKGLHSRIMEKIKFYREQFDSLREDKNTPSKSLRDVRDKLHAWDNFDVVVYENSSASINKSLFNKEPQFAQELARYINEVRQVDGERRGNTLERDRKRDTVLRQWASVFARLKNNFSLASVLLREEIIEKFGLNDSCEKVAEKFVKNKREQIICKLKENEEELIYKLVKALATNYSQGSMIDGQYNSTKLKELRTYYSLKANDDKAVKALESQMAMLKAAYKSLVEKCSV